MHFIKMITPALKKAFSSMDLFPFVWPNSGVRDARSERMGSNLNIQQKRRPGPG
jgi:hypothetical protein